VPLAGRSEANNSRRDHNRRYRVVRGTSRREAVQRTRPPTRHGPTSHVNGNSKDVRPTCRCRPAPPRRLDNSHLGPGGLDTAGGCTTIFAARLSQSRSAAGLSRCCAAGLSQSGIWRAWSSAAASARGDPTSARRRDGLATRLLELAQTRLGMGVRPLCLPPLPAGELGSRSLDPTTRGVGLGAGALVMRLADH